MGIQSSKRKDNVEKKFEKLHQQVYGKTAVSKAQSAIPTKNSFTFNANIASKLHSNPATSSDIANLSHSLKKILILSSIAIGAQFLLFYLIQNHYINLNFLNIKF